MLLDFLQIRACRRLFAPQARKPHIERLEGFHERSNFAKLAASRRIGLIEQAALRFLLWDRLFGKHIHEVQVPLRGEAIAEFVSRRKVVARIEEQNRKFWQTLAKKIEHNDVFSLETACQASTCGLRAAQDRV